jgi:hypothetical protein
MDETILGSTSPKTASDYKAAFAEILSQITSAEESMQNNRIAIDRLKAETEILKAETNLLKARSQERIDALMAAL